MHGNGEVNVTAVTESLPYTGGSSFILGAHGNYQPTGHCQAGHEGGGRSQCSSSDCPSNSAGRTSSTDVTFKVSCKIFSLMKIR